MAEQTTGTPSGHKNEKVGQVVSARMQKTIVVEVTRRVPHPIYKRIINKRNKFYAHDEQQTAKVGDVVRIIECRPMSHLKRWQLGEVIRKAVQVAVEPAAVDLDSIQQTSGSKSLGAKSSGGRKGAAKRKKS
ncbi:MAG: 30S ribosomal protein S17 [Acidobacteriota bacterium]|jgi:small subunit ribosomal protein S17|nr:30S ribosomal protein S17 [Acidobacteriota bacterium]